VAKQKTYKQWVEFHYKKLKKQMPDASENVLRMMAGDAASKSIRLQGGAPAGSVAESAVPAGFTQDTPRVGPGASPMPIPTSPIAKRPTALPTPAATPSVTQTPPPGGMSYNDRIVQRIKASGTASVGPYTISYGPSSGLDMPTFLRGLSTADYTTLQAQLKRLGYNTKNKEEINQILMQVFPQYFPVTDVKALLVKLKQQELPGAGGEEAQLPQRRMQQVDRGTLRDIANTVAKEVLMMEELPKDFLDKVVSQWEKKAERGTVTTVKKVRNPKTGKMEEVVSTKGGFMQDLEEQRLAERLKAEMPQQVELAEGIGFADELKKLLAGGM
jgi:hypothetical protein